MSEGRKQPMSLEERAARYVEKLDGATAGAGGHAATFHVACVLAQGFGLSVGAAQSILEQYNARCSPPWSAAELRHKLNGAEAAAGLMTKDGLRPRGCLRDAGGGYAARAEMGAPIETDAQGRRVSAAPVAVEQIERPGFNPEKLKEMAGAWSKAVDLVWLANRSARDPAQITASGFLQALYKPGEKVVCFSVYKSQGQAVWPVEKVPSEGAEGVWFLAQPVDGKYHPNPRSLGKDGQPKMSRRSEESVTDFRYIVLESDVSDMRDWLGLLVQLPLRIEAIYTSGGRSIHALVRVDCATRRQWDEERQALLPTLNLLHLGGNDAGALSCVRLTRLPGALRLGKADAAGIYRLHRPAQRQKLLYLQPNAPLRAIKDLPVVRDVEGFWCGLAAVGVGDADEGGGVEWIEGGLGYYANVSARCVAAREAFLEKVKGEAA
ncbi:MAG: hypothetical protein H7343_03700 [Undibacterium sp.]|nr:hypothetical protein [Opitutaceae bacterium]